MEPLGWLTILSTFKQAAELSVKLYNAVRNSAENKKIAEDLSKKITRVYENLTLFSNSSNITPVAAKVAEVLQDETKNVNEAINSLLSEIQSKKVQKKIKSFLLSSQFNSDIKRVRGSVRDLENAYMNFGMQLELQSQIQALFQVHNVSKTNADSINNLAGKLESLSIYPPDVGYDAVELKQIEAFSNISYIIKQVESAEISRSYKKELISVLDNVEKTWRIPYDDFSIDLVRDQPKLISATGGFKNVYEGKLNTRSLRVEKDAALLPVAVLEYSLVRNDLAMYKGSLLREIYFSWRLTHPCIVKTYGAFWPGESEQGLKPKIFCELMTHNLRNARHEDALQDDVTRYSIAVDVAEGLLHLHNSGFVHRDIKPENILLRIESNVLVNRAKICDFGASREIRTTSYQSTQLMHAHNQLTPIYAPPEEFKELKTTCAYDLWGFGLILCWLDGNPKLQLKARPGTVALLAENGKLSEKCKVWVRSIKHKALRQCAEKCTNADPKQRGTIADALSVLKFVSAEIHFNERFKLWNEKNEIESTRNLERAVELFRTSAELGNIDSMYRFGMCMLDGIGVEKNLFQAASMMKNAADRGHIEARNMFYSFYKPELRFAKNDSEAFEYCKLAADLDVSEAKRLLGEFYESGIGVEKDYESALLYYQLAADKEDGLAQLYLGNLYYEGKGTSRNLLQAQKLYELSARKGIDEAIYKLKTVFNVVVAPTLLEAPSKSISSTVLQGHDRYVECMALSSDGRMIVTGGCYPAIKCWNAASGEPIGEPFEGHTNTVVCVAISDDGYTIVSVSLDNTVRRWNAQTGESIGAPLEGLTGWVTSTAVSCNGNIIVSGLIDKTVRRWNAKTGKAIGEPLEGHTDYVSSVALSRDGTFIVSASWDYTLRRWDTSSGMQIGEALQHNHCPQCVAISCDMKMIVSGDWHGTIQRWHVESGREMGAPLLGHTEAVRSVSISCDGNMIVSGSKDGTIRRWDAKTGKPISEPLESHKDGVSSVAISNDYNMIVSGSWNRTVKVWTANNRNDM